MAAGEQNDTYVRTIPKRINFTNNLQMNGGAMYYARQQRGRVGRFSTKIVLPQFGTTRTMHFLSILSGTTLRTQPPLTSMCHCRRIALKQEMGMHFSAARTRKTFVPTSMLKSLLAMVVFVSSFVAVGSQPSYAIPAFARKYGLPCSACHIGWPILNVFGQQFRDNGFQLGNERDAPIYQNPSYWPITFRVTPQWHLESQTKVQIDDPTGNTPGTEQTVTTHGFDLSGLDIWTAGTLYKNISFSVLPAMEEGDGFHFENAWVRFDNLLHSPWLNVKLGKFELDSLLSEKRFRNPLGRRWCLVQLPLPASRRHQRFRWHRRQPDRS